MGRLSPRDSLGVAQRSRAVIAGLLVAGVLSAGCVATIEPEAGANTTPQRPTATAAPNSGAGDTSRPSTQPGAESGTDSGPAPDVMRMPLVGGGDIDLAAYFDTPLLLWFWAPF